MPNKIKRTQEQKPEEVQGRDLFQTPHYAVDLLIPFIPESVHTIWECAAGENKITYRLMEYGYQVLATDLRPNIYVQKLNFLLDDPYRLWGQQFELSRPIIVTNPPFSLKQKFYHRCRELSIPFALLIPADYSGWMIKAVQDGCEKIVPTRRIDYITPTGLSGASGHTSNFHSLWLTYGFNLGKTETFVELTNEDKTNI